MRHSLLNSLLELGHATSQNLAFAHRADVSVSYGEETITETNLLELRRRHPAIIRLNTFGKKKEALNGADWEWHIIGRVRTFRMRVQAKRLQRNDKLKIPHKVASSGKEQIDLLIADAKLNGLMPVYCFYCTEAQRAYWTKDKATPGWESFETGCLVASAHRVKSIMPKSLPEIEKDSIPWHYLVDRRKYERAAVFDAATDDDGSFQFLVTGVGATSAHATTDKMPDSVDFPTIDELNQSADLNRNYAGVIATQPLRGSVRDFEGQYLERGIRRLIEIDVREIPPRLPPDDGGRS